MHNAKIRMIFPKETFEENEICELQEIYLFEPKHTAIGVARHSPFKKMVTYGQVPFRRSIKFYQTKKKKYRYFSFYRLTLPASPVAARCI